MEFKLQLILIVATILLLLYILSMVRRGSLELKYSLVWIFISIGLIALAAIPNLLDIIAFLLGVKAKENAIFLVGIGFELIILFTLTISSSRNSIRVKKMAQEIALLNRRLEEKVEQKSERVELRKEEANNE